MTIIACHRCRKPVESVPETVSVTCGACTMLGAPDPARGGRVVEPKALGLASLIRDRCCNQVGSRCIRHADGRCRVAGGDRCGWFESSILPEIVRLGGPDAANVAQRYAPGMKVAALRPNEEARPCPDCGTALGARQRYCQECALKRAKSAARERIRRHRENGVKV